MSDEKKDLGRLSVDAHEHDMSIKEPVHVTKEIEATSVDLAVAAELQKPQLWSKTMMRVYYVMTVGYLVSTIQGYGKFLARCALMAIQALEGCHLRAFEDF